MFNTSVFQGSETHTTSPRNLSYALLQPQPDQMDKTTLKTVVFRQQNRGWESRMHRTVRRTRKVLKGYWQLCTRTEILWRNSSSLIHPSIGCGC